MNWTKHPLAPIPNRKQLEVLLEKEGPDAVYDLWQKREEAIRLSKEDPLRYGFILEHQKEVEDQLKDPECVEVNILGGHRSAKSHTGARIVTEALVENPGTELVCWSQNQETSIQRQQPYIWEMLPPEYKTGKIRDSVAFINYSKAGGFVNNKLILPNGSACYFYFYSQFLNDSSTVEGANLGAFDNNLKTYNIGCWLDEYLLDEDLISRIRSRCSEKNSKIIVTFTPMNGYTPYVKSFLDGAITLSERPADLLGGRMMPTKQKCAGIGKYVFFFHSDMNPFSNTQRLKNNLAGKSEEEIMKIFYGYPTKSTSAMFNNFDDTAHTYDPEVEVYDFSNENEWTNYHFIDPAGNRAWANIWASVNAKGQIRIWDEFPNKERDGDWAVEGTGRKTEDGGAFWRKGRAATDFAHLSFGQMKEEWDKIEQGITIFERAIDSRFGHNPRSTANDGEKNLQDDLLDFGIDVVTTDGAQEEEGLSKIRELFSYDNTKPFNLHTNCPTIRISRKCGNLIHIIKNYSKRGKPDEALKDFIDLLRYVVRHNAGEGIEFMGSNRLTQVRPCAIL